MIFCFVFDVFVWFCWISALKAGRMAFVVVFFVLKSWKDVFVVFFCVKKFEGW
jgi:hypothetical protein